MKSFLATVLVLALVSPLAACQTAQKKVDASLAQTGENRGFDDLPVGLPIAGPLYFDYDTDTLNEESLSMLRRIAGYMRDREDVLLVVTGHCDERGDEAYNLALGDRRAAAARAYLQKLGVDPSRVRSISLGEEDPAVDGSDEVAWSWNRRDEFQFVLEGEATAGLIARRLALPPIE